MKSLNRTEKIKIFSNLEILLVFVLIMQKAQ